ncbi:hypothetical protein DICVIV_05861 [Dictyocaulus viviparus]|uniref:Schlafen AlbA-2 domain-containing protein n=1 Tax=Dictyocaulus viviparus TaxID=29172 RepID=A0A0D8Y0D7_DICVI|nr:hypothetical protein DICVIV_05861 [Dictyocaulus viviparus]
MNKKDVRLRLGEKCQADEDRCTEFKMHHKISLREISAKCQKWENGRISRTMQPISKTICAFLNTVGGVIYVGIGDNKGIYGKHFNDDMMDHFLLAVYSCVSRFNPPVPEGCIKVGFAEVDEYNGNHGSDVSEMVLTPELNHNSHESSDDYYKAMVEFQQLVPKRKVGYHVIGKMQCPCVCDRLNDEKLYVAMIKVTKPPGNTVYQNDEGLSYYRRNGSNKMMTLDKVNTFINTVHIVEQQNTTFPSMLLSAIGRLIQVIQKMFLSKVFR